MFVTAERCVGRTDPPVRRGHLADDEYQSAAARQDRAETERLELFRKDTGTYVRLYDFMSQVIEYENTGLEKLCVFLRQFSRVIESGRLDSAIDLSGITLKHVKHIHHGTADIPLTGDQALKPITGAGSRAARRDPK